MLAGKAAPLPLFINEHLSTKAIIETLKRYRRDKARQQNDAAV